MGIHVSHVKERIALLKRDVVTVYLCFQDPRTPVLAKCVVFLVLAYAVSPIDLIPDFIPVLGLLDDLILISLGVALAIKLIPTAVWAQSKEQAAAYSKQDIHIAGVYGVLIVGAIWLLMALGCYAMVSHLGA